METSAQLVLMFMATDTLLAVFGIIIAFAALAIGFYHVHEIRKVIDRAETQLQASKSLGQEVQRVLDSTKIQLEKTESLEQTTSTRYLDEFPNFLLEINKLINDAHAELFVFCDIPAYGNFSDQVSWISYCRAIEDTKKKERFKLELVCLSPDNRLAWYDEMISDWDLWKNDHLEKLKHFLWARKKFWFDSHKPSEPELIDKLNSLTRDDFKELLEKTNEEMIEEAFADIEPKFINGTRMPVFFWLADKKKAIFSIPDRREKHTELGFVTSDTKLIEALLAISDRYLAEHPDSAVRR